MARKVIYQLVDDLDGTSLSEGEGETVKFGLDGTEYEIDLSDDHAKALRDALADYVDNARRVTAASRAARSLPAKPAKTGPKRDLADVRAWANANEHPVSERGRIPTAVLEAYDAAH